LFIIPASVGGNSTRPAGGIAAQSGIGPALDEGYAPPEAATEATAGAEADAAGSATEATSGAEGVGGEGGPSGFGVQAAARRTIARSEEVGEGGTKAPTLAPPRAPCKGQLVRWSHLVAGLVALTVLGCEDPAATPTCGKLPEPTACPGSGPGDCADSSCSSIYSCQSTTWVFAARCPQTSQNDPDGGTDGGGGSGGSPSCQIPTGGGSCPPLADPECDAAILDGCPDQACTTGCDSFLRCQNGDWSVSYVAYCDPDGNLVRMSTPTPAPAP
jgi:hypothetical protein